MLHRTRISSSGGRPRDNSIRAHLAEFGIVARVGRHGVEDLLMSSPIQATDGCPRWRAPALAALGAQFAGA